MTVHELIEELQKVEDKGARVFIEGYADAEGLIIRGIESIEYGPDAGSFKSTLNLVGEY